MLRLKFGLKIQELGLNFTRHSWIFDAVISDGHSIHKSCKSGHLCQHLSGNVGENLRGSPTCAHKELIY